LLLAKHPGFCNCIPQLHFANIRQRAMARAKAWIFGREAYDVRVHVSDAEKLRQYLESQMPPALDWLRRMVEINSFTCNPAGVDSLGRLTAEAFAPLGFTAEFVPSTNSQLGHHLFLTRPGSTPLSLALVSHLDTVFPPEEEERNNFRWQPEGDLIFGPGTHDIKGGTVMIWLVLSAIREQAPDVFEQLSWRIFLNSSEEVLSEDFAGFARARMNPSPLAALVFEAEGRLGEERLLVVARKGRATWRVTATGRGAHSGGKHRHGVNAIVQLAHTVQQIAALTDYGQDLTFNVGTVTGGTVLNRVPHQATVAGEMRAFKPEVYAQGKSALLGLAGPGQVRSRADGFASAVNVEILTESRPWPRNPDTDRLLTVWEEAGRELGISVQPEERGGLSDGNCFWDILPTIDGLGPWGDNDHCSERSSDGSKLPEYVDVTSFVPKAILNVVAILKLIRK
jgi:glutamate carboxypeptidase